MLPFTFLFFWLECLSVSLPRLVGSLTWFFATPQVVWECTLLNYFLHCVARGGMSLTAAAFVYSQLWGNTMQGTMYSLRTHFVSKLCMALVTWSSLKLILRSGLDICSFTWYLRPHHESADFAELLQLCKKAFRILAATHKCTLWTTVKAVIVDGKWCIQTSVCNERGSGAIWNDQNGSDPWDMKTERNQRRN